MAKIGLVLQEHALGRGHVPPAELFQEVVDGIGHQAPPSGIIGTGSCGRRAPGQAAAITCRRATSHTAAARAAVSHKCRVFAPVGSRMSHGWTKAGSVTAGGSGATQAESRS